MSKVVVRSPELTDRDEPVVIRLYALPEPQKFREGGLARAAERVRRAGRDKDEVLLHLSPAEFEFLRAQWGEPTINPETGLPEYGFLSDLWDGVKKTFKKVAPFAGIIASAFFPGLAPAIGGALGASGAAATALGNAVIGGVSGGITGGGRGALAGALGGGLSGYAGNIGSKALGALGVQGASGALANAVGQGLLSGATGAIQGRDFRDSALRGGIAAYAMPHLKRGIGKIAEKVNPPEAKTYGYPMDEMTARPAPLPGSGGAASADAGPGPDAPAAPEAGGRIDKFTDLVKKYGTGALLLGALSGGSGGYQDAGPPALPPGFGDEKLPPVSWNRRRNLEDPSSYFTYGMGPEHSFFQENTLPSVGMARGGELVRGPGTGRSDEIPARLSDGEYVIDAETVALLGDGSIDAGAARLDKLRENVRKHKGRKLAQGKFSDNAKDPMEYLGRSV